MIARSHMITVLTCKRIQIAIAQGIRIGPTRTLRHPGKSLHIRTQFSIEIHLTEAHRLGCPSTQITYS